MKKILAFLSKYAFWVTMGLVMLLVSFLGLFLYTNLYRAITETEVIVTLRTQYAVEPVSFDAYRNLALIIEEKKTGARRRWDDLRNPFIP